MDKMEMEQKDLIAVLQRFALLSRGEAEAVVRAHGDGEKCYVEAVARISPDPAAFITAALAREQALNALREQNRGG